MKIVSAYLLLLVAIVGILSLSMVWQFNSFQQNLSHLSLSLPASQIPPLDINQEMQKIAGQAANEFAGGPKKFTTPDKTLSFSYSPLWQEAPANPLPAGQGTMVFSASQINITQLSAAYLTVRQLPLAKLDDVISELKNEGGSQATIADNGPLDINGGQIETLDASYGQGLSTPGAQSNLNARDAIIVLYDKSYIISVWGSQNIWNSIKTESDSLFGSIQINQTAPQK